jgi:hypothetical protein
MKRLLERAYARQSLVSYRRFARRQEESANVTGWAAFYIIIICALLLSGLLG